MKTEKAGKTSGTGSFFALRFSAIHDMILRMNYSLLIFDLDNTIFNYDLAENQALDLTLESFGVTAGDALKQSYREINEKHWKRLERGEISSEDLRVVRFEEFGRTHGLEWDPETVSGIYLKNLGLGGFLIEGAEKLLKELKPLYRLASVTNGISDVQRARLEHSVLKGFFDPLIISDEVGISKPDPGIFEILFHKAGISDKSTVLMIGDSLSSDIAGAAAFGIDSCWYNPLEELPGDPHIKPDYSISSLADLRDILDIRN